MDGKRDSEMDGIRLGRAMNVRSRGAQGGRAREVRGARRDGHRDGDRERGSSVRSKRRKVEKVAYEQQEPRKE